jgi:hypothetical protein
MLSWVNSATYHMLNMYHTCSSKENERAFPRCPHSGGSLLCCVINRDPIHCLGLIPFTRKLQSAQPGPRAKYAS